MVSFSKQLTDKQFEYISKRMSKYEIVVTNIYVAHAYEYDKTKVYLYKSKKLLIQGKSVDKILKFLNISVTKQPTTKLPINCSFIGCDEVGTGDYFGGIVCTACYIPVEHEQTITKLGVNDSKKLTSIKIHQIYDELINLLKFKKINIKFDSAILSPEQYNNLFNKLKNANAIKAYCHNAAINRLLEKVDKNKNIKIVLDQFVNEKKYYEYLKKAKVKTQKIDILTTKAESKYLAVALASIISRVLFENQMKELSTKAKVKIPFGSVDQTVKKVARKLGSKLPKFAKLHFKITNELN